MSKELIELGKSYSQRDLADKLGVSQSYVSMLMSGARQPGDALKNKIRRLQHGTETVVAKWEKEFASAIVTVTFTCPPMESESRAKLTQAIAYHASAYLQAEAHTAAGLPSKRPKPLP